MALSATGCAAAATALGIYWAGVRPDGGHPGFHHGCYTLKTSGHTQSWDMVWYNPDGDRTGATGDASLYGSFVCGSKFVCPPSAPPSPPPAPPLLPPPPPAVPFALLTDTSESCASTVSLADCMHLADATGYAWYGTLPASNPNPPYHPYGCLFGNGNKFGFRYGAGATSNLCQPTSIWKCVCDQLASPPPPSASPSPPPPVTPLRTDCSSADVIAHGGYQTEDCEAWRDREAPTATYSDSSATIANGVCVQTTDPSTGNPTYLKWPISLASLCDQTPSYNCLCPEYMSPPPSASPSPPPSASPSPPPSTSPSPPPSASPSPPPSTSPSNGEWS